MKKMIIIAACILFGGHAIASENITMESEYSVSSAWEDYKKVAVYKLTGNSKKIIVYNVQIQKDSSTGKLRAYKKQWNDVKESNHKDYSYMFNDGTGTWYFNL